MSNEMFCPPCGEDLKNGIMRDFRINYHYNRESNLLEVQSITSMNEGIDYCCESCNAEVSLEHLQNIEFESVLDLIQRIGRKQPQYTDTGDNSICCHHCEADLLEEGFSEEVVVHWKLNKGSLFTIKQLSEFDCNVGLVCNFCKNDLNCEIEKFLQFELLLNAYRNYDRSLGR